MSIGFALCSAMRFIENGSFAADFRPVVFILTVTVKQVQHGIFLTLLVS